MRFTKLGHSCVRLEEGGDVLVIDPGSFSDAAAALDGARAVMVAPGTRTTSTRTRYAPRFPVTLASPCGRTSRSARSSVTSATRCTRSPGDALEVAGYSVHVYGVDHALIHQDIPLVVNTGFLVEAELFHPGDSYNVPEDPVNTLCSRSAPPG